MKSFYLFLVVLISPSLSSANTETPSRGPTEITVNGTAFKSNKHETLNFDLQIGTDEIEYAVKGGTSTDMGYYKSILDFSPIHIRKQIRTADGRTFVGPIPNGGKLTVYPRKRVAQSDLKLAGLEITGSFLQGYIDDGLWFDGLTVNDTHSKGCLDYRYFFSGHYNARGDCHFGDCSIRSSTAGKTAFDYDNYWFLHQNKYTVTLAFDQLVVKGSIQFNDNVESHTEISKDSNGNTSTTTTEKVTATTGNMHLTIQKNDHSVFNFAKDLTKESADDVLIRKFIAFLELITFDLFAE